MVKKEQVKFWIGLTYNQRVGKWLWADGSPLDERFDPEGPVERVSKRWNSKRTYIFCLIFHRLKFWNEGKPDNPKEGNAVKGCVRMDLKSHQVILDNWFDRNCTSHHKSICEKPTAHGHLFCV